MEKEETIRGQTRYRTGKYYSFRRCPKHDTELELCIDDTDFSEWSDGHQIPYNHHENRILWRCSSCLIHWNENYFIKKILSSKIELPSSQLILICPNCNSNRVTHDCVPECCTNHYCIDCNSKFEAEIKLEKKENKLNNQDDDDSFEFDFTPASSLLSSTNTTLTGVKRSYRKCIDHPDEILELAFIHGIEDLPTKLDEPGWYCRKCDRVHFERGAYRLNHSFFSYEVNASIICPVCESSEVNSQSSLKGCCVCLSCGSEIEIKLKDRQN